MDDLSYDDLDLVDNIFAPERKKQKEEERVARLALTNDMTEILKLPAGRRFIYWLIERGAPFRDDYNGKALDLAHMAGQKLICSEVTHLAIRADPMIFAKFVEMKLTKPKEEE